MIDESELQQCVSERIKTIRKSASGFNMTQKELADVLGLERSSVANMETGAQRVSLYNVYLFCEHLGLDLMQVLPDPMTLRFDDVDMDEPLPERKKLSAELQRLNQISALFERMPSRDECKRTIRWLAGLYVDD